MANCRCGFHPERAIDGFTALDGTIKFYGFVKAILMKTGALDVLDFGAGRGGAFAEDLSVYRRYMRDLRVFGAQVTACDVDDAVLRHPASDRQMVIKACEPLPFADESYDVIVSDMTFEHIEDAPFVAGELLRVLKKGGYICARTPNRFGYVRLIAGLVPNCFHAALLNHIQPERKSEDVFPTLFRMNSPRCMRKLFNGCNIYHFYESAEPAYFFGNIYIYRLFMLIHKLLPSCMSTSICLFIKK